MASSFKASNSSSSLMYESAWEIPEEDCKLFDKAREITQKV